MMRMDISDAGLDLIKQFEGFSSIVYNDSAGLPTIGYGHKLKNGETLTSIGQSGAMVLLRKDVSYAELAIFQAVDVLLAQYEYDALCSLVYNIGGGNFLKSTLLEKLNDGQIEEAADQFLVWDKVHVDGELQENEGLKRRREAERKMFLG